MSDEWWRKVKPVVKFTPTLLPEAGNRYQRRKLWALTKNKMKKVKHNGREKA